MIRAGLLLASALATALSAVVAAGSTLPPRDRWSPTELQVLAAMRLDAAGPPPVDVSNAYEGSAEAATLGRALFNDARFSRNGRVSCATCHAPDAQFQDGRPLGQGLATGRRRTMPVMDAGRSPFLFWDGRKDSLWSQALGPMEDGAEQGGNRVRFVRVLAQHYAAPWQRLFGPLPPLEALPDDASPLGTPAEQAAWAALPARTRADIDRVFADMGKAIAAYERRVHVGPSRFDRYVAATLAGDAPGQDALSAQEARGLRLFLGKAQCATCHSGPMLTDQAFHNTGVPPSDPAHPDRGRADATARLLADEFNCLGAYSDAKPEECAELNFLAADDPTLLAAFRTPGLRNVAARAPYMHAGQFATLEDVVRHYVAAPPAVLGRSELARPGDARAQQRRPIELSPQEVGDLVAFLGALTGPVLQPGGGREGQGVDGR